MKKIFISIIVAVIFTFAILSCTTTKSCPAYGSYSVDTEQINDKV